MKSRPRYFDFSRGLQTTRHGRSGSPDDFATFQDVEVDRGGIEARKGHVRLAVIDPGISIANFDGSDDTVAIPSEAGLASLALTQWTLELLFVVDDISSERYVLGRSAATQCGVKVKHEVGGSVVVVVRDSAGTESTMTHTSIAAGTLCSLAISRNGASLSAWLNGTTQTTTMHATNALASGAQSVGSDNAGSYLDGAVDRMTLWSEVRTNREMAFMRLANPRSKNVMFDYVFTAGPNADVTDRGRKNAHAVVTGTPTYNRTALALNVGSIQALAYNVRKNGTREVLATAHGRHYAATVK